MHNNQQKHHRAGECMINSSDIKLCVTQGEVRIWFGKAAYLLGGGLSGGGPEAGGGLQVHVQSAEADFNW